MTAARKKRRKFALRKIKKTRARATVAGRINFAHKERGVRNCVANLTTPACLVVCLNLRVIKFGQALARFGRRDFVNLTAPSLRL